MQKHILVKDDKYEGKYVAFTSVIDHTIIAQGKNPKVVMEKAKANGADQPLIMFVPHKKTSFCY